MPPNIPPTIVVDIPRIPPSSVSTRASSSLVGSAEVAVGGVERVSVITAPVVVSGGGSAWVVS